MKGLLTLYNRGQYVISKHEVSVKEECTIKQLKEILNEFSNGYEYRFEFVK